ncbi:AroM family protein [Mixta calida]|uniref:AroM family protein n=1 Tax=Mixta calida TaxID=665913 RepID=UPI0034D5AE62
MKQTLVIVTIAHSPRSDITPLLLEHLPEEQILRVSLLEGLSAEEIEEKYAPEEHERTLVTHLPDGSPFTLSADKVEEGLQQLIWRLEAQGTETILLLGYAADRLQTHSAVLLEPDRIVPPLVKAIVDGHQVGVMISAEDPLRQQAIKWRNLSHPARFAVASPYHNDNETLIDAALQLQEQGADVVVLDSPGYHQRHRDCLQQLLGIPVLLSHVLLAKIAAELLV